MRQKRTSFVVGRINIDNRHNDANIMNSIDSKKLKTSRRLFDGYSNCRGQRMKTALLATELKYYSYFCAFLELAEISL